MPHRAATALLASLLVTAAACSDPPAPTGHEAAREVPASSLERVGPPPQAAPGSFAPYLAPGLEGPLMTWLEPVGEGAEEGVTVEAAEQRAGYRLRFSRLVGGSWHPPVTVAQGPSFFANWADVPVVREAEDGTLLAAWLERTGEATYAYGVRLARSVDQGRRWRRMGFLHDDDSSTEHGFVSLLPAGEGSFRAFWLDGRETASGGPMTLRTTRVEARPGASLVLDERVCDCCPTAAARTADGPLVVYRDRTEDEVRDVQAIRRAGGPPEDPAWSEPEPVHRDGWVFPACPVNGPAVATGEGSAGSGPTDDHRLAVAWFTAEGGEPRVQLAFSSDAGRSFGPPVEIDRGDRVLGRVGVVLTPSGEAVVSWLVTDGEKGLVELRRVAPAGRLGRPRTLAETLPTRAAGIPRLLRRGESLYVAWVRGGDDGEPAGLGFGALRWEDLPAPRASPGG